MNTSILEQHLKTENFQEAKLLLDNGEKLPKEIQDHQKSQLLDKLLQKKQFEIIEYLIKDKTVETDIYELDNFDKSIFQSIVRYLPEDDESISFLKSIMVEFDNLNDEVNGQTLLGYFLEQGSSLDVINALIEAGCDPHFKNNAEQNYIHRVVKLYLRKFNLNDEQLTQLVLGYVDILVEQGVDINEQDIVNKTPLIYAIEFNKKAYLKHLLELGADPNLIDKDGNSAFYYAIVTLRDNSIYDQLAEFASADFNQLNKAGVSILFEYTRMLNGNSERDIIFLKKLIEDGADPYQPSSYYSKSVSPLSMIAEKSADALAGVLETGAIDINRQDDQGNTLLHLVCAYNVNYEQDKAKETYRKVKLLLDQGADPSITNDNDQTPLMLASDDNLKAKTVELLMKLA
ncbi:ankyrin repeat domain-containing protein [Pedobacter rhizosphaerae]|uniref:Ankyrin repeat-containing protein n=1 Tax=Pedobacter rhizosphaerae TaxID=390241 RepID=A0A1H9QD29_9SPHI|nr:ankyrin repeat domain-containing protein [Pedobacter rhizosphaerae]SER58441.1 Ankyrin repeat-containing protein [Pedobacter rhizosphaerae]